MKRQLIISILFIIATITAKAGEIRFAAVFTDNMVLQQDTIVKIWGMSSPGEKVEITCSWQDDRLWSIADQDGNWVTKVKTGKADFRNYEISISDSKGNIRTIHDIVFGEIWLCSGQSNMEMILMSQPAWNLIVEDSEDAILKSENKYLRVITIGRKESFTPEADVITHGWKVSNPENAKWFSAVAYFFGKKLFNELNVPIGIIVTSYAGSPIQSWIPEETLCRKEIYSNVINDREREKAASRQSESDYYKAVAEWIRECEKPGAKDITAVTLTLPVNMEKSSIGNQMGEFSLTKAIEIEKQAGHSDLYVSLGTMDDLGRVYFNGELVWEEIRNSKSYSKIEFTIPAAKVKEGTNTIEARVLNVLWGGGLTGPSEEMFYIKGDRNDKKSLAGEWSYHKIFDLKDSPAFPSEGRPLFSTAASLYNGMLFPLRDFCIRGVLWYQGEENVKDASNYTEMMEDMVSAWRNSFGSNFPFYFVQIAPYQYGSYTDSNAALLREAQSKAEETIAGTAMVVTMDIGDPANIHPGHKREVGERLAMHALSHSYGINVKSCYPKVECVVSHKKYLEIFFSGCYDGLRAETAEPEFEVSADGISYKKAVAEISGTRITLSCKEIKQPVYVRYCWRDGAIGTLINSEGLPLSSFSVKAGYHKKETKTNHITNY